MDLDEAIKRLTKNDATLTAVDLRNNHIGDEGARALALAIKGNTRLAKLDLWDNRVGNEGVRALAEAIKGNTTLIELNLWTNWICDAGAKALADALEGNRNLVTLDLAFNRIDAEGAAAVAEALKHSPNLLLAVGVGGRCQSVCAENRKTALGLFEKSRKGDECLTEGDIEALEVRLPAIRVVATEVLGEKQAGTLLERVTVANCAMRISSGAPAVSMEELFREAVEAQKLGRRFKHAVPFPIP